MKGDFSRVRSTLARYQLGVLSQQDRVSPTRIRTRTLSLASFGPAGDHRWNRISQRARAGRSVRNHGSHFRWCSDSWRLRLRGTFLCWRYAYLSKHDYLEPPRITMPRLDRASLRLFYLELPRLVTRLEDQEIRKVALGGADTAVLLGRSRR
jgi:hypothetical protein